LGEESGLAWGDVGERHFEEGTGIDAMGSIIVDTTAVLGFVEQ
jgi:hypothetical protein